MREFEESSEGFEETYEYQDNSLIHEVWQVNEVTGEKEYLVRRDVLNVVGGISIIGKAPDGSTVELKDFDGELEWRFPDGMTWTQVASGNPEDPSGPNHSSAIYK